jgi:hypothetical protein
MGFQWEGQKGRDHKEDLHKYRWKDNINRDLIEIGWMDWIHLAQDKEHSLDFVNISLNAVE